MGEKRLQRYVAVTGLLVLASFLAGCNELELKSAWRDRDIAIDGNATDWRGLTTYVEQGNIAVGVANDHEDLFVCLHSPTREVAGQIVLRGLTVWFDPAGGADKQLGFRCPIGRGEMPGFGDREMDRDRMREMIQEMVDEAASRVEILGPDDTEYGTFPTGDVPGLEIALGYADGRIVYELKVPLDKTDEWPYALGADREKKIGIKFVTPEVDDEAMRSAMRDGMGDRPPGGGGSRGGGRPEGGMPGNMPNGMRGGMPQALELRCRAELALPAEKELKPQD